MSGELSTDKAEYLTIKDLQMLKHGLRDQCGCKPICPACREVRDLNNTMISAMLKTDFRFAGEVPQDIQDAIAAAFP